MRKLLIATFLILFSSSALSDFNWKLMGETKNADKYYIDLSSIEKDNNKRFYIRLRDYGKTDENGENSSLIFVETNCENMESRFLKDVYFKDNMGMGEYITLDQKSDWMIFKSDSLGDKFNKFVEASARTIAKTGRSLSSIAGIEYGDITKKFLGYASEMGIGFDHFVDHAKNAAGEIILFKEGLQMSIDTLEDLTFRFGEDSFGDFAKQIVGGADKLGLSLQNVSKNFQAGIKDANNFGYMTRKELSATSLFATKLGMEMSELTSFADGFDTFEGAAEKVGKLSAAFGIQLDTMDLVMEDNPAKKLDMVREALEKSGQSIENILGDRRQAKYLADTLNLPIEQLEKLSSISTDEFGFSDAFDAAAESQEELTEMDALKTISDQMRELNNALN